MEIIGKKLLVLTAHPDDEAFVAGGTVLLNNKSGGSTVLACATRGENGRATLGMEISEEEVKKIRSKELDQAARETNISRIYLFDFPDRDLAKHKEELLAEWSKVIEEVRPDIILGFGKDGYTGHVDHIVAGEAAHELAVEFKIPYYAFSLPGGDLHQKFESCFQNKRAHGSYSSECSHEEPDIQIEIDGEEKYRILKIYKSQFPGLDPFYVFPKEEAEHFLRWEYFKQYN